MSTPTMTERSAIPVGTRVAFVNAAGRLQFGNVIGDEDDYDDKRRVPIEYRCAGADGSYRCAIPIERVADRLENVPGMG